MLHSLQLKCMPLRSSTGLVQPGLSLYRQLTVATALAQMLHTPLLLRLVMVSLPACLPAGAMTVVPTAFHTCHVVRTTCQVTECFGEEIFQHA